MRPVTPRLDGIGRAHAVKAELLGEISAQPRWLTDVVATVVHAHRGGVKAVAAEVGVPAHAVYQAADINDPKPLKAWWLPGLCRATGTFAILDAIETQVGRVAFRLPDAAATSHDALHAGLAATLRDVGAFVEAHGDVLRDGRIDPHELEHLQACIDQAIAGLCEYRQLAAARVEHEASPMAVAR